MVVENLDEVKVFSCAPILLGSTPVGIAGARGPQRLGRITTGTTSVDGLLPLELALAGLSALKGSPARAVSPCGTTIVALNKFNESDTFDLQVLVRFGHNGTGGLQDSPRATALLFLDEEFQHTLFEALNLLDG